MRYDTLIVSIWLAISSVSQGPPKKEPPTHRGPKLGLTALTAQALPPSDETGIDRHIRRSGRHAQREIQRHDLAIDSRSPRAVGGCDEVREAPIRCEADHVQQASKHVGTLTGNREDRQRIGAEHPSYDRVFRLVH